MSDGMTHDTCQECGAMSLYGDEERTRGLCGACAYNADHPDAKLITLNDLDHLLDRLGNLPHDMREQEASALVGYKVDWHGSVTTIVRLRDGRIALELALECARCHSNAKTVYMTSGLHAGAWPYARDFDGTYLANLRDQEYVCDVCNAKTKPQPSRRELLIEALDVVSHPTTRPDVPLAFDPDETH